MECSGVSIDIMECSGGDIDIMECSGRILILCNVAGGLLIVCNVAGGILILCIWNDQVFNHGIKKKIRMRHTLKIAKTEEKIWVFLFRVGNQESFHYARRQFNLPDDQNLRYSL